MELKCEIEPRNRRLASASLPKQPNEQIVLKTTMQQHKPTTVTQAVRGYKPSAAILPAAATAAAAATTTTAAAAAATAAARRAYRDGAKRSQPSRRPPQRTAKASKINYGLGFRGLSFKEN